MANGLVLNLREELKGEHDIAADVASADDPLRDLAAYPILTEEVGYPPAPMTGGGGNGVGAGRVSSAKGVLGQTAAQAITDVLGWKFNASDANGFMGALEQSFKLTEVEGHTQASWVPRTYAVQTDLAGGITGAQASLLYRMKEAVDQSLPLIDGLIPLRPDPDWEYIAAAKAVIKSQLQELIAELSLPGSLRVARVDQIFDVLFEPPIRRMHHRDGQAEEVEVFGPSFDVDRKPIVIDPDFVGGQVGELRLQLGLSSLPGRHVGTNRNEPGNFVNTVEDEANQTNYRMIVDYLTSIWISWLNNRRYFELGVHEQVQPFFGTQLVLISRSLSVVSEKVNELQFVLDSVFVGPAQRQAFELQFPEEIALLEGPPVKVRSRAMFLADLLNWVASFATDEGPRIIQSAGRYGVRDSFLPVARTLYAFIVAARVSLGGKARFLPPGMRAPRVLFAWDDLAGQLRFLVRLAEEIRSPMALPQ